MNQETNFFKDSNSEISIREIVDSDLDHFKTLLLNFYIEIDHSFSSDNLDAIVKNFLGKGIIIVSVDNSSKAIVGFVAAVESNALYARGSFGVVNELYIIPEFRSKKIGQKLIDFLIQIGKNKLWSRLELDTPEIEKSEKTINFYKKEGFVTIGYRMKKVIVN
jgi:GNAT superfamily N-acetyltransferase